MTATPLVPRLWSLLARWRGWTYGPMSEVDHRVDCSALVASVLRDAYGRDVVTPDVWRSINLSSSSPGPWGGVEAVAAALGTEPCLPYAGPHRPELGRVSYCQGWRRLGTDDAIMPTTPDRRGSSGHAWLWLATGPWEGVCVESSVTGPRVWDGRGQRPIADVVSSDGRLAAELVPMAWDVRAGAWDAVAWTVLP